MKLIGKDTVDGYVVDVFCGEVVVQFDTGDDVIEQLYDFNQFQEVPKKGDYIRVVSEVFLMPPPPETELYVPKREPDNHFGHDCHRF